MQFHSFHDFISEFLSLFKPRHNPFPAYSEQIDAEELAEKTTKRFEASMENKLTDVSKLVCMELGYYMNRIKIIPCYEFIVPKVHELGFHEDSKREEVNMGEGYKFYGPRKVYQTFRN